MLKISLLIASATALVTGLAHVFVGQAHLTRILDTSVENVDSAVMFAVWHMVTVTLLTSGIGLLLLTLSKQQAVVRVFSLTMAIFFCLFGVVFIATSFLYSEPAIQWIPMLIVAAFSFTAYLRSDQI